VTEEAFVKLFMQSGLCPLFLLYQQERPSHRSLLRLAFFSQGGKMAQSMLLDRLYEIIKPITADHGLELVEVQYRQEESGWVLRIIIHRAEGISVDDCARVSRESAHLLDVEDIIPHKYHLEVSSPGLDRPLITPRDFERNIGKKIKITFARPDDLFIGQGTIEKVHGDLITLKSGEESLTFSCDKVKKAKLLIEF
jgi:ribosome maturation factor RimP